MNFWKEFKETILPSLTEINSAVQTQRKIDLDSARQIAKPLSVGTRVMAHDPTRETKWDARYEGPFTITSQGLGGAYSLKDKMGVQLPT